MSRAPTSPSLMSLWVQLLRSLVSYFLLSRPQPVVREDARVVLGERGAEHRHRLPLLAQRAARARHRRAQHAVGVLARRRRRALWRERERRRVRAVRLLPPAERLALLAERAVRRGRRARVLGAQVEPRRAPQVRGRRRWA